MVMNSLAAGKTMFYKLNWQAMVYACRATSN